MLSIGIPHGSVDHLIAFINPKARKFSNKFTFYIVYLSLIALNVFFWIIDPFLGLTIFLIISDETLKVKNIFIIRTFIKNNKIFIIIYIPKLFIFKRT